MANLREVRKEYDETYRQMVSVIRQMGGESNIWEHRQQKTALYRKLCKLQQREHYLNNLEKRYLGREIDAN